MDGAPVRCVHTDAIYFGASLRPRSTSADHAALLSNIASTSWRGSFALRTLGIVVNEHYDGDGDIVFKYACMLGCEGIVSKRLGSTYRSGRADCWVKVKNPKAPAVRREAEEDWGR
jgi:bifunctional non-homologous end joining protein LigD